MLLLFYFLLAVLCFAAPPYCQPQDTCWPNKEEISTFISQFDDNTVILFDLNSIQYITLVNQTEDALLRQYPSFIILCKSSVDIQNVIIFAANYNIQISILSTGHSYSGINTANNSIQINLSRMKNYKFNLSNIANKSTLTVETGLQWGQIYNIINTITPHKIIIGGSDPSVGPGGYSMGGGHSPQSPRYGLSCDFITEYYMIDANANIIHVYNTSGSNSTIDDLFWALKGGGGSTFGVVLNITFRLHDIEPPNTPNKGDNVYTFVKCVYSMYYNPVHKETFIGNVIINNYWDLLLNDTFDTNWGGYIYVRNEVITFAMNYFGNHKYAKLNINQIYYLNGDYNTRENTKCVTETQDYFADMASVKWNMSQTGDGTLYQMFNDLIPQYNLTHDYTNKIFEYLNDTNGNGFGSSFGATIIRGNVHSYTNTAVSDAMRNSVLSSIYTVNWGYNSSLDNEGINITNNWELKLREFGNGIYLNEENQICDDCDWKQEFWGTQHYNKLLNVKQMWDPEQVFFCTHCVASE